jgi:hypothetical protein
MNGCVSALMFFYTSNAKTFQNNMIKTFRGRFIPGYIHQHINDISIWSQVTWADSSAGFMQVFRADRQFDLSCTVSCYLYGAWSLLHVITAYVLVDSQAPQRMLLLQIPWE